MKFILSKPILSDNLSRIGLISFVILFLELLLIRLIATEIRIFAYLSNLVLLAAFVGSGLGLLIKKRLPLFASSLSIFTIILMLSTDYILRLPKLEFRLFKGITELLAPLSESYIWLQPETISKSGIVIGLLLTALLILLIAITFVPLGQFLGKHLNQSKQPIMAYSVNIAASILGMWTFYLMSALGLSPFLGLVAVLLVLLLAAAGKINRLYSLVAFTASLVLLTPRAAYQPFEKPVTFWSPYQKLVLSLIKNDYPHRANGWFLEVNNVGYMGLLDLSAETLKAKMPLITKALKSNSQNISFLNQYDLPYQFVAEAKSVLIIGGGAGNDAAAAVRRNIKQIKVVEIDPKVVSLGRDYHPEKPYDSPRVTLEVNDGRAYIETAQTSYDLIIFSLADSHTLSSSLTNLRLDNYLYTLESLQKVKKLLNPQGVLVLTFEVTRPWIGQRLQKTLTRAFGHQPKVFEVRSDGVFGWGGVFFVTAKNNQVLEDQIKSSPELDSFIVKNSRDYTNAEINLLTDDWPYVYLDKPRLPSLHLLVALMIVAAMIALKQKLVGRASFDWSMFFLGGGFILYEFQNISKSSLLFGNTWTTSLFIITGVLSFILLANFVSFKKLISFRTGVLWLFASLIAQMLVPLSWFSGLNKLIKVIVSVAFLNLPHFFSGVIFAYLFKQAKNKSLAFGSNLLGSAIGGLLEILSFVWGVRSLIYVTLVFYFLGVIKKLRPS